MTHEQDPRDPSAEGIVVEIVERGGERFAKILMPSGSVIELPTGPRHVTLGERVAVHLEGDAPADAGRSGPPGAIGTPVRPERGDYRHVWRMAAVFAAVIVLFLAVRAWLVPSDFGVYGHYRAGAIVEAAARPNVFAGQGMCVDCHTDVQELRAGGKHAKVACEACHGPLGAHARGDTDVAPIRPSTRGVCLTCHTRRPGMPAAFPAIVEKDHSEAGPCTDCHASHKPGL